MYGKVRIEFVIRNCKGVYFDSLEYLFYSLSSDSLAIKNRLRSLSLHLVNPTNPS